jgi:hypothetical protein
MDFEDIIKKNEVKSKKKLEKLQRQQEMMNAYASMKTRSIQNRADIGNNKTYSANDDSSSSTSTSCSGVWIPGPPRWVRN